VRAFGLVNGGAVDCGGIGGGMCPGPGQFAAGVTFCKARLRARWRLYDSGATLLARGGGIDAKKGAVESAVAGVVHKAKSRIHVCGSGFFEIWSG